ncbi:Eco57I restriction-modification methylase domain-containing protein [Micromonosporaceae bacterium Da 78-11]
MSDKASISLRGRNPDVLTCIANLSNDEVFTPPEFANRMLDNMATIWAASNNGKDLWSDPEVTFLDPFTKSGVFLREITARLTKGLENAIPDLQERVNHVLRNQVFGIGITGLTAMLARRSLYCSKWANGPHSVATIFDTEAGNVWFERTEHTWVGGNEWVMTADRAGNSIKKFTNGKCKYCGASQLVFDREYELETHAYAFIHTDDVAALVDELFGEKMQFDVIIGNPPYQSTGGGGGSNDSPIYHLFVQQAKRLEPRLLCMVIPSRWMAGGRGLGEFRAEFLEDKRIRTLVDYENAQDAFPTVGIGGGICYFLWDRDNPGLCECSYHRNGEVVGPYQRSLDEFDTFVRDKRAVDILQKVVTFGEKSFSLLVSGDTPFGLATNFKDYIRDAVPEEGQVRLYANIGTTRIRGAMGRNEITKNRRLVDQWKLLLPKTGSGRERERSGVDIVLGPSIVAEPGSVCTQTYLVAGPLPSEAEAQSMAAYLRTRLARFLVSLRKISQDTPKGVYTYLPQQKWDRPWTDVELYEKYGISDDERVFIESLIRPMAQAEVAS